MERKVIYYVAASVDGYIARKNGAVDWLPPADNYGYDEFIDSVDTVLLGNTTYKQMMSFGQTHFKGKKNYVFSRKKQKKSNKPVEFIHKDVGKFVADLKRKPGKDIWLVGGSQLASALFKVKLVDLLTLFEIPILLGEGIPLFHGIGGVMELELLHQKSYSTGVLQLNYSING